MEHGADAYASDDLSEMEDVLEEPKSAEEKRKRFLYDDQQKGHRNELLEALEIRSEENEGEFGGLIKVSSPKTTTESDPNVQNSEETIQKVNPFISALKRISFSVWILISLMFRI